MKGKLKWLIAGTFAGTMGTKGVLTRVIALAIAAAITVIAVKAGIDPASIAAMVAELLGIQSADAVGN